MERGDREYLEVGHGASDDESAAEAGRIAARAARAAIRHGTACAGLVYVSDHYDLAQALAAIREEVGATPLFGATTTGEIDGGIRRRSLVVVLLASPRLTVHGAVGSGVSSDWRRALDEALADPTIGNLIDADSEISRELLREGRSLFALLLYPGSSEAGVEGNDVLRALDARCGGRIPILGGAFAAEWRSGANQVVCGAQAWPDSLLVAIFETQLEFGLALGHGFGASFGELRQQMTVTEADGDEIVTLDGVAAADVLARRLGSGRSDLVGRHLSLGSRRVLGTPPAAEPADATGAIDASQLEVHVASYVTPRGGIHVTPPVAVARPLVLLEPVRDRTAHATADATRSAMLRGGIARPALILVHYGALRPRLIDGDEVQREFDGARKTGRAAPMAGLLSYGEIGLGDDGANRHGNASVAVLVLGDRLSPMARVALANERERDDAGTRLEARLGGELEQARRSLLQGRDILRLCIDSLPDLIAYLDPQTCFRFANLAYREWFGVDPERLVGRNLREVYGAGVETMIRPYVESALAGRRVAYEHEMVTRDDRRRTIRVSIVPHAGDAGTIEGLLVLIQDLTPRIPEADAERTADAPAWLGDHRAAAGGAAS